MIAAAFIVKQIRTAPVRGHEHVQESVVINVCVSCAPSDFRRGECRAHGFCDLLEFSRAQVAEQMRRLGIADTFLYALDFIFYVAVGNKNVGPPVIVVIEEETTEA